MSGISGDAWSSLCSQRYSGLLLGGDRSNWNQATSTCALLTPLGRTRHLSKFGVIVVHEAGSQGDEQPSQSGNMLIGAFSASSRISIRNHPNFELIFDVLVVWQFQLGQRMEAWD